jgi:hypothetical protein
MRREFSASDKTPRRSTSSGGGAARKARGDRDRISFPETDMQDVLWIAVTLAFFAVSIAYVHFCERVK